MHTRRSFIRHTGAAVTAAAFVTPYSHGDGLNAQSSGDTTPWLRKSLKGGMLKKAGASLKEQYEVAIQAGFEGVEPNTGSFQPAEAAAAAKATGLVIDGTVCGDHWQVRHTDPNPDIRKRALASLISGIEDTAAVGADTMLLVPGHGKDGDDETIYHRALENIRLALPTAEKHGVSILMENVWNDFLYDHEGGDDQSADRLAKFVDDFGSPWVGVQFDIGNHWKYADPAKWIRTLDSRIKKLDIKGFSREKNEFTPITLGDIDWPSVEQALHDIGYTGWLAAEVGGGDLAYLTTVAHQMEMALQCSKKAATVG